MQIIQGMPMHHTHSKKKRRVRKTRRRRTYRGGNSEQRYLIVQMIPDEGLGNALFIFAAGLVAQEKFGLTMILVPATHNKHTKNDYRTVFEVKDKVQIMDAAEAKPLIDAGEPILHITDGHSWATWHKDDMKYDASSGKHAVLPMRFYQNYPEVRSVVPAVKEIMMKNEFSKNAVYRELEKATPEGSAFIHVRRGDFLEKGWQLEEDYYVRGLAELNKDPTVKHIWVLSHDLDWSKKIPWTTDRPIDYYDSSNELEVLYKMMLCTAGAVTSASSFSSWGAMMGVELSLSKSANTKIVYPRNWFGSADLHYNNPLRFPERWIGIKKKV